MTHILPIYPALLHMASSKRLFDHLYGRINLFSLFSVVLKLILKQIGL